MPLKLNAPALSLKTSHHLLYRTLSLLLTLSLLECAPWHRLGLRLN